MDCHPERIFPTAVRHRTSCKFTEMATLQCMAIGKPVSKIRVYTDILSLSSSPLTRHISDITVYHFLLLSRHITLKIKKSSEPANDDTIFSSQ